MTNEVTKTANSSLAFPTDGPDIFAKRAADLGAIQGSFLKFDGNSGDFEYGPKDDAKEVTHGTLVAANMTTFKSGWICWVAGEAVEEIMVPILEGEPPAEDTLTDHGPYVTYDDGTADGWQEQNGIELRLMNNGELLMFKSTSKSGKRAFGKLLQDFAKIYRQKPNQVPVVELSAQAFEPKVGKAGGPQKKIGKKFAPILKIVDWMPVDDFEALVASSSVAPAEKTEGEDDASNYANDSTETTEAGTSKRARRTA
jgi:hypothetical protein